MNKLHEPLRFSSSYLFFNVILNIYVVVQFYPRFKFYFSLCLGMVIYDNELKQRKSKFKPGMKLNHSIYNR